jgi:hypothetical protein
MAQHLTDSASPPGEGNREIGAEAEAAGAPAGLMSAGEDSEAHQQARNPAEEEIRSLNDQLAALRGTLAGREKAFAKAALETEQLREQAEAVRKRTEGEIRNLNGQLGRLRGLVTDHDKTLANAASETQQVREQAEAARIRAEGEIRHLSDQLTALQTSLADREKALAHAVLETKQMREQAEAARDRADGELRTLNDRLAATIADGEAALAKATRETERVREQGQRDLQAALAKAEAREAGEATRLAAAEAAWRQHSATALSEATARYEAAERVLTQLRPKADEARSDAVGGSIELSGEPFGTRVGQRETEVAAPPMPTAAKLGLKTEGGKVILRQIRMLAQHAPMKRAGRYAAGVAVLAALLAVAYPNVEPLRTAIAGGLSPAPSEPAPSTPERSARVTAAVNLRTGPSRSAAVIATLPRAVNVTVIDGQEGWMLVRTENDARNGQRQGWVFGSFLQDMPQVQDVPQLRSSALSASR